MIQKIFFSVLTFFCVPLTAQNFTAIYSFLNVTTSTGKTDPGPPPQVKGLSFGNFYSSGPAANPNASGRFSFTGWPVGAPNGSDNYADYTAVLSPFNYYEVGIAVAPGYTLELNRISFYVRRSGTGIRTYCVRGSRDNFNDNLSAATGTNTNLSVIPDNVFFWKYDNASTTSDQRGSMVYFDSAYQHITDTVSFRFFAWNAEASGGSFSIDNVQIEGLVKDSAYLALLAGIEPFQMPELLVGPNPVRGGPLFLKSGSIINAYYISDVMGHIVAVARSVNVTEIVIDTSQLKPGVYMLNARSGERCLRRKILVE